jgi:1,4-dihydroxy-2-naphthoate octaprenyltransferase
LFLAWRSIKPVINKVMGKDLIPVLVKTGQTELLWALLISLALVLETN